MVISEAALGRYPSPVPEPAQLGKGLSMGDFEGRDYQQVLTIINSAASRFFEANQAESPTHVNEEIKRLEDQLNYFKEYVADNSNYVHGAEKEVISRYQTADQISRGKSTTEQVAARISGFDNIHFVTDFDGTVTKSPPLYILRIPASQVAEPILEERGRDKFPSVFVQVWQPFLRQAPVLFEAAGDHATIREGVDECFKYLKETGARISIDSANFEPFVEGALARATNVGDIDVYAITPDNLISTAKDDVITHLAKSDPDNAIIYVGDGGSDLPALNARDFVAAYFALEDSVFHQALIKAELPYFTYRSFTDIRLKLEEINAISARN